MLNLLTEFEHELIAERTRAGLARGRREGRIGGRHPVVIDRTRAEELAAGGLEQRKTGTELGISAATVSPILRKAA